MNEGLIPRRYAKALLKVDKERKTTQATYRLMKTLADVFVTNGKLQAVVSNPFVAVEDKVAVISAAAQADSKDKTFNDFLKLLIANHRVDMIGSIAKSYVDTYREMNNIKRVEVVSAAPLDKDVEQRIKTLIQSRLNGGSMDFTTRIDPELIGGFVVRIDNEQLDASVRNQLKDLRLNLLKS